ncbi:MAG: hypothetical protein ABI868_09320 [Acidobacteriota bacterium]
MMVVISAVAVSGGATVSSQAPVNGAPCPAEPALFQPCALARARTFAPPRTPDGRPDLQGIWRGVASGTENIEDHPKTGDDDGGKSLLVDPPDGKVPYQAWAAAQPPVNRKTYVEPNVPCFPSGVPRSLYVPTQIEILQSADHVLILLERAHTYRIIPIGTSAHVDSKISLWQGDSRGHWENNTLVVDVTNQNGRAWFDQAGNFYSAAAHMIERFTLIDADTIHYQVTIDDPGVYTRAWTMAFPLTRNKQPGFRLLEEACHEGERNTQPLLDLGYRMYPGITGRGAR